MASKKLTEYERAVGRLQREGQTLTRMILNGVERAVDGLAINEVNLLGDVHAEQFDMDEQVETLFTDEAVLKSVEALELDSEKLALDGEDFPGFKVFCLAYAVEYEKAHGTIWTVTIPARLMPKPKRVRKVKVQA